MHESLSERFFVHVEGSVWNLIVLVDMHLRWSFLISSKSPAWQNQTSSSFSQGVSNDRKQKLCRDITLFNIADVSILVIEPNTSFATDVGILHLKLRDLVSASNEEFARRVKNVKNRSRISVFRRFWTKSFLYQNQLEKFPPTMQYVKQTKVMKKFHIKCWFYAKIE